MIKYHKIMCCFKVNDIGPYHFIGIKQQNMLLFFITAQDVMFLRGILFILWQFVFQFLLYASVLEFYLSYASGIYFNYFNYSSCKQLSPSSRISFL